MEEEIVNNQERREHKYFGAKLERIWKVVKKNLPNLKKNLRDKR